MKDVDEDISIVDEEEEKKVQKRIPEEERQPLLKSQGNTQPFSQSSGNESDEGTFIDLTIERNSSRDVSLDIKQLAQGDQSFKKESTPIAILIEKRVVKVFYLVPTVSGFVLGMMQVYIPFSLFALLGDLPPGLWLLGPVLLGGTIGLAGEILKFFQDQYKNNPTFKILTKASTIINLGLLGFLQDFGFMWTTLLVIAAPIKTQDSTNTFAKLIAPCASLLPAILLRTARLFNYSQIRTNRFFDVVSYASFAASAPIIILKELLLQQQLAEDSLIPILVIAVNGAVGALAGIMKKSHVFLTLLLVFFLELGPANFSLATALFSLLNSVYSAEDNQSVSNDFFWANLGGSCGYLVFLSALSLATFVNSYRGLKQEREQEVEYSFAVLDRLYGDNDNDNHEIIDIDECAEEDEQSYIHAIESDEDDDSEIDDDENKTSILPYFLRCDSLMFFRQNQKKVAIQEASEGKLMFFKQDPQKLELTKDWTVIPEPTAKRTESQNDSGDYFSLSTITSLFGIR